MLAAIPGTIKASFSWANNKKMARELLQPDNRCRENASRLWGAGRIIGRSMAVIEGFYLTAKQALPKMARYERSTWWFSVASKTYEVSRAAIAKSPDRLRRFVNDPSGHF